MTKRRLLKKILAGSGPIRFSEATALAEAFGFSLNRINASYHIFTHPETPELINLQNVNGKAKPYQLKQLLSIVEKHGLHMEDC